MFLIHKISVNKKVILVHMKITWADVQVPGKVEDR